MANHWRGLIVHDAVRDRAALATPPRGVKVLGSNPRRRTKEGVGEIDQPGVIAGVTFLPGKRVWADVDSTLVER